jgi:hypothetical protein
MATATNVKPTGAAAQKTEKPKKEPKPLLVRLDEQITRAVIAKKINHDDMAKFEGRVTKLKGLLEE